MKTRDLIVGIGNKLDQMAEEALEYSQSKGYDRLKINTSCSFQKKLVVENKEFTLANSFDVQNFSLVLHNQQKSGSASINTASIDSLKQTIDHAAALASFSVKDEALNFPDSKVAPTAEKLDFLFDEALADMSLEEMRDGLQEVLEVLTEDKRFALDRLELDVDTSRESLFNSLGVRQNEAQTTVSWSWMGMAVEGDVVSGFDYDYNFSYQKNGFIKSAKEQALQFRENIVNFLYPNKCPSYKGLILLSPRAVNELLTDGILFHASGRSVMDGKSKWSEKVDQAVTVNELSLFDCPHERDFMGTSSYDQDGLPTRNVSIIENGILKTHLMDCYTARKLGKKPTGISGGPFGLTVAKGSHELKDLFSARSDLLVVDRFSGNSDPITGDFSGVAKNSKLYRNGKDAGAVSETMIAGNFFEMLKEIKAISDQSFKISGSFSNPWILIDGISVTGG